MTQYTARVLHSLVKVFPDTEPVQQPECLYFTMLRGETFSFQVAYGFDGPYPAYARVDTQSPLAPHMHVRQVCAVPSLYPASPRRDANYLRTTPGLYPDLLSGLVDNTVTFTPGAWKSLWIDIEMPANGISGTFPIEISFLDMDGGLLCNTQASITVYDAVLPSQTLLRTEWLHGDCLADYYGVEVFSEQHWDILKNFIRTAVRRGINMILTPQFTPPLDTQVGGERTTIQLVDVTVRQGNYTFDFSRLKRWVDMCLDARVCWFEMSHLFTQWGALAAPKVIALVDGKEQRIFGWDTPATGGEYTRFLSAYLPELVAQLKRWGIADRTYFHISDEPRDEHLLAYMAAKESVAPFLKGFPIVDALSSYAIYETGAVGIPVCANNHIEPFLAHQVSPLWTYYCVSQGQDVSNRFMAMPSARARIFGVQVFKYGMQGVLHWGYNFYNTQYSLRHVDPYRETDAGGCFPSGDPFIVYPGADGKPEESIRLMVMDEAMADVRALEALAAIKGKNYVVALIDEGLAEPITFSRYPAGDAYLINLRNRVNAELAKKS